MSKKYTGEILGTLQIKSNYCTDSIFIKPIRPGGLIMYSYCDTNEDKLGSLIDFNGNQIWKAYYFKFPPNTCHGPKEHKGWNLEWKNITLRLCEKEFERNFGKYEILDLKED